MVLFFSVMDHYAHEGLWFKCHPVQKNNHYTESCVDPTGRSKSNTLNTFTSFSLKNVLIMPPCRRLSSFILTLTHC